MYKWLNFGRKILLFALINDNNTKIVHPIDEEVRCYQSTIGNKYPNISEVSAVADGLKFTLECPELGIEQFFLNGWIHGHYINSVFVFCPDGKIRVCLINAPGVFHDSAMSDYGVYEAIERVYLNTGGKVVVDFAFNINTGGADLISNLNIEIQMMLLPYWLIEMQHLSCS